MILFILNMKMGDKQIIVRENAGEIHFNGEIDEITMHRLTIAILELEDKLLKKCRSLKRKFSEISDEKEKKDKDNVFDLEESNMIVKIEPSPIKLYITSPGGYIYQVFGVIDTIKSTKVPVHTYCKGMVASAGTLLSLAGKKRYISENSYMLIHELRGGNWGKYSQLKDQFENQTQLMKHIKDYYIKYTKLTDEQLEEQLKKDNMWNAEKCLEVGLVDEIIKN